MKSDSVIKKILLNAAVIAAFFAIMFLMIYGMKYLAHLSK